MLRSPFTFATQVQLHQGQLWAAEVSVAITTDRTKVEPWIAFLASLMGPTGTFLMGDPLGQTPMGTPLGSPKVILSGQTGNTLGTKDWTANTTNALKAGDYIQIGSRLYKVLQNFSSDASGNGNIEIWPRLRESPAINTAITTSGCKGLFRLADSEIKTHEVDKELVYSVTFSAVEAI
jgi:hypothetical protein